MRQTLHIFKKDARHLRWEIALALLVMAAFAFADARRDWSANDPVRSSNILKLLPVLAWFILIARVIQSEAPPGDKQFWLTRPYSWKSLLAAKILFLLMFIALPLTIADAAIVTAQGFPIREHISGLIWTQILWGTQFVLPVAALAAIASGLRSIVLWAVAIVAADLGLSSFVEGMFSSWGSLEWIRNSINSSVTAGVCIAILIWQYARRRTFGARTVFACLVVLGSLASFVPLSAELSPREPSSLTVVADPLLRPVTRPASWQGTVETDFPLRIAGVPEGLTARTDLSQVRIESADGRTVWRSDPVSDSDRSSVRKDGDASWLQVFMNRRFFERVKSQPIRIRAMLFLTLYGNQKTITLPAGSKSVPVPEVGLCGTSNPILYRCWAPFRGPRFRLANPGNQGLSYAPDSPLPAEIGVSPLWVFTGVDARPGEAPVNFTLTMEEPMGHLRRDLTLDDIRMAEY